MPAMGYESISTTLSRYRGHGPLLRDHSPLASGDNMKANTFKRYRWLSAVLMLVFSLAIHGGQEVSQEQPLLNALNNLKQGSMHGTRTGDYAIV